MVADYYNEIFYYESLLFAGISIKFLNFIKLNDTIKLFFSSLEVGIIVFAKYCLFLTVILLGYACVGHILWGRYISEFGSFSNSFVQILLFTGGIYIFF
jgi:hypothetical protein